MFLILFEPQIPEKRQDSHPRIHRTPKPKNHNPIQKKAPLPIFDRRSPKRQSDKKQNVDEIKSAIFTHVLSIKISEMVSGSQGSRKLFPLPRHIEEALYKLFSRKHHVGDIVYEVAASIPSYYRIVLCDEASDTFRLQRLATRRMLVTNTIVVYDYDHSSNFHEYVDVPSYEIDMMNTLADANHPVVVAAMCCTDPKKN